jgi:hypothetical protein
MENSDMTLQGTRPGAVIVDDLGDRQPADLLETIFGDAALSLHDRAKKALKARGAAGRAVHQAQARHEPVAYEPGKAIAKIKYSHDAMIDEIITNPGVSQNTLAALFGYTPGWVSQVMSSDAFANRLEQRKEELVDPQIRMTLNEKFKAMVNRSIDIVQNRLANDNVDIDTVMRAAELGVKALGLGVKAGPSFVVVPDRHVRMAERITAMMNPQSNEGVLDVQATEIANPRS